MKKLNTDSITNELVNSSFFPRTPQRREEETPIPPQAAPIKPVDDDKNRACFGCTPGGNRAVFSFNVAAAHEGLDPDF